MNKIVALDILKRLETCQDLAADIDRRAGIVKAELDSLVAYLKWAEEDER